MIIVLLFLLATILCAVKSFCDHWSSGLWSYGVAFFGILTLMLFIGGFSIIFGDNYYTGYIYELNNIWDKTEVHIRLSKEAGEDGQPIFCVNKEDADEIMQYVGRDIKVKVTEPAGFGWSYTKCNLPVTVEVIDEE